MKRREMLSIAGATAAGMVISPRAVRADHGKAASPPEQLHAYLCAFHIAKKNPKFQLEAHHYCSMVSQDVHQCIIFDGNGKGARILGVEYIISDKLYRTLPDTEKKYYHPHNYEVIAGLLMAPGMPEADEKELMSGLVSTWGKTWHTWPDPKSPLPMGEPLLMWAITGDGQIDPELLAARDRKFNVSTPETRKRRAHLGAVPQIDPPKSLEELGRQ